MPDMEAMEHGLIWPMRFMLSLMGSLKQKSLRLYVLGT